MSKYINCALLLLFAISLVIGSVNAKQFTNIVIGEGCASTCVNGVCESSCKGKTKTNINTGHGDIKLISRNVDLAGFHALKVNNINANIRFGQGFEVELAGTTSCIDALKLKIEDGNTLNAYYGSSCQSSLPVTLNIQMPKVIKLAVLGNSTVEMAGFEQNTFDVHVSDNSALIIKNGVFQQLSLAALDNAELKFVEVESPEISVAISGRSDVSLGFVNNNDVANISGKIEGLADLKYCGGHTLQVETLDLADVNAYSCADLNS